MLAALIVALAVLTGRTGATDTYYTVFDNVTGIKFGTQVLYEGYPIGQVEEITPMPEEGGMRFRVDLGVREGWRVPADSVARITASGLLAAVTVGITAGTSTTPLEPGDQVISQGTDNILTVVASVATDVRDLAQKSLKPLIETVEKTVRTFGDLMDKDARRLFTDLDTIAREVGERVPRIADNVDALILTLSETSDDLRSMVTPENRQQLEEFLKSMEAAAGNLARLAADLETTRSKVDRLLDTTNDMVADNKLDIETSIVDLRHVMDTVARHIDAINQNMEGAARNLYEFSRQIRQNPGLLLGGTAPRDEGAAR
jgi:phospholipid/cholesterol/gamma-HCH transport system substrate-binding protein